MLSVVYSHGVQIGNVMYVDTEWGNIKHVFSEFVQCLVKGILKKILHDITEPYSLVS